MLNCHFCGNLCYTGNQFPSAKKLFRCDCGFLKIEFNRDNYDIIFTDNFLKIYMMVSINSNNMIGKTIFHKKINGLWSEINITDLSSSYQEFVNVVTCNKVLSS